MNLVSEDLMDSPWSVALEDDPDPALRQGILASLITDNEAAGGPSRHELLAVTVRDRAGAGVGGLWGRTGYGFLFVELLALGAAKGQGLGRTVMGMAEAEARRRGLLGMWVDTFTFQAPRLLPEARLRGLRPDHRLSAGPRQDLLRETVRP